MPRQQGAGVPEISFQAAIWVDAETGNFRIQIRPYAFNDARTYVAMMDSERLSRFVTLCGADPQTVSGAVSPEKALVLEGVEIDDANELAGFGFALQQGTAR
jgi:hypothetical protein